MATYINIRRPRSIGSTLQIRMKNGQEKTNKIIYSQTSLGWENESKELSVHESTL